MIHDTNGYPLISIIIVNFNGCDLLGPCLTSLAQLTYPQRKIEVIVVDNNSLDDSVLFVTQNFPQVVVVQNSENLGFTGGNIAGYKVAKGKYIVLLNSDVTVDKNWLTTLVARAKDPQIGIIASRLRFATPFVELLIESAAVPRSKVFRTIDHSPIGVLIEEIVCETPALSDLVYYKDGFYDRQDGEISTRRTQGKARVLLPFKLDQPEATYLVTLHGLASAEKVAMPVNLLINGQKIRSLALEHHETIQLTLKVSKSDVDKSFIWLVQNAGNVVLRSGYGKDRGSVVMMRDTEQKEFYEEESAYFLKPTELLSACGASCLIKREVIEKISFFDDTYFMYYEDVEFCLRTWRAGWKIFYEPLSVGYHQHRATTGSEESAFFLHLVEKNHLAFVITHFPLEIVAKELSLFLARFGMTFLKYLVFQFSDNETRADIWRKKHEGRKAALFSLFRSAGNLLKTRYAMNRMWPINQSKLQKMLY
jgi:hypothetical protein